MTTIDGGVAAIPASTSGFIFIGPTSTITLTGSQVVTGTASTDMMIGAASADIDYDLCYLPNGQTTPSEFHPGGYLWAIVTTARQSFTAVGAVALPAGQYQFGMCVSNLSGAPINGTDFVQGVFSVVNETTLQVNSVIRTTGRTPNR